MRDQDLSSRESPPDAVPERRESAFAEGNDHPESTERRRFLKRAALASAPVILTVASRPAWGHACAPSGMCSGNLSDPTAGEDCAAGAYGPKYYEDQGPNAYTQDFNAVFTVGPSKSFSFVLRKQTSGGVYDFPNERAFIAAYLNASADPTHNPNLDTVFAMVNELWTSDGLYGGVYMAGACAWTIADAASYLYGTFGTD